jgi:hypothetical protein
MWSKEQLFTVLELCYLHHLKPIFDLYNNVLYMPALIGSLVDESGFWNYRHNSRLFPNDKKCNISTNSLFYPRELSIYVYSNIATEPPFGLYISQLIRYSRACGSYYDFLGKGLLLTRSYWTGGFYLINRHGISVSQNNDYEHVLQSCPIFSLMTFHLIFDKSARRVPIT